LLKEKYDYSVGHVQTNLEAIIPTADKLKLFQVAEAVPLLKVTSIHITGQNVKLYYEESIYRSDKFILNVNIYRK
jgi:GntR family transcriptional regulator